MATRALLTERERDVLAGEAGSDAYRATVRSRVRNRLVELEEDVEVLATHESELYDQLRETTLAEE